MKTTTFFLATLSSIFFLAVALNATAQEESSLVNATPPAGKVFVFVKLFDANKPTAVSLSIKNGWVFYRNPATHAPELLREPALKFDELENNFWRIEVPKDILIEQIVLSVSSKSGTNYNPAVVAKVVTRGNMLIYPGASDPEEKSFHIYAYLGQMSAYQTILSQLLDEFPEKEANIKEFLLKQYGAQLEVMSDRAFAGRIVDKNGNTASAEHLKMARDIANKVMIAYGIRKEATSPKPLHPESIGCGNYFSPHCNSYPNTNQPSPRKCMLLRRW